MYPNILKKIKMKKEDRMQKMKKKIIQKLNKN